MFEEFPKSIDELTNPTQHDISDYMSQYMTDLCCHLAMDRREDGQIAPVVFDMSYLWKLDYTWQEIGDYLVLHYDGRSVYDLVQDKKFDYNKGYIHGECVDRY